MRIRFCGCLFTKHSEQASMQVIEECCVALHRPGADALLRRSPQHKPSASLACAVIGMLRAKKKQQRWSRSSGDCHAYKPAPSSTLPGCASSPVQMRRSNGRKQKQAHRYTLGLYCAQGFHASSRNPNGAYVKSALCYRTCYDNTMPRRVETFELPKLPT